MRMKQGNHLTFMCYDFLYKLVIDFFSQYCLCIPYILLPFNVYQTMVNTRHMMWQNYIYFIVGK